MAGAAGLIAIDTNILVYAHRSGVAEHRAAQRAILEASRNARGWGLAFPCIVEFFSVVTHPKSAGGPATARHAYDFLRTLTEAGAAVWLPSEGSWGKLLRTAADLGVQGSRIFDLQIALAAFENGASEIWTYDKAFVTLPGLAVHHPL